MKKVTQYVMGFLFSPDRKYLVMIKKDRPEWMAGLLNGVGGHIEEDETAAEAMRREFREETGVDVNPWTYKGSLSNNSHTGIVEIFVAHSLLYKEVKTMESEQIITVKTSAFPMSRDEIMSNLNWIVPAMLDGDLLKIHAVEE